MSLARMSLIERSVNEMAVFVCLFVVWLCRVREVGMDIANSLAFDQKEWGAFVLSEEVRGTDKAL